MKPLFGLIFCISLLLSLSQCKKQQQTPDWEETSHSESATKHVASSSHNDLDGIDSKVSQPTQLASKSRSVKFMYYNLRNYLTMRRGDSEKPKPEHEISALIRNIKRVNPDILGVCEIGSEKDLADFSNRLKAAGLELPHSYLTMGTDPTRRQAILSRYPIKSHSVPKRIYRMKGVEFEVKRGILDATVNTPKGDFRFIGAHLKSKRPSKQHDHNLVRRNEALILRKHVTSLLSAGAPKLIVYGDMNDTKNSPALRAIKGPYRGKLSLRPIDLEAPDGTRWTQHWTYQDIYSRIDFILASETAAPHIDHKKSYLLSVPRGDPASDHRALVAIIK